ncbi:carbohydrate porin [Terricaulis sp.]|uniref:carbohydrate porin n=1 Tax=Terricaulis sp. TaxID=2768686 RepID=UPI003784B34D
MLACAIGDAAYAQPGVELEAEYTGDIFAVTSGGADDDATYLDNLDIAVSLDLDQLAGWRNTTFFVHALSNAGGMPNEAAGTLQGVDNIEVSRHRARLYEMWLETEVGGVNLRGGLYDLNSEFYANDSAGLLLAPAFGIGSELAATGPNGPSIFPSTALALRIAAPLGEHSAVRFAALNANAGVLGDPGGVDTEFDRGALLVGEWAWAGATRLSIGGWLYTDKQDDIRETVLGVPLQRRAAGVYATVERALSDRATGFARVGVSDGDTTPYVGGWQAGVLITGVAAGRADSQLSFGAYQGVLGEKFRDNLLDAGVRAARAETGLELTYSDQLTSWLRLQPDLQFVLDPAGDRDREDVWTVGLRFAVTPFAH